MLRRNHSNINKLVRTTEAKPTKPIAFHKTIHKLLKFSRYNQHEICDIGFIGLHIFINSVNGMFALLLTSNFCLQHIIFSPSSLTAKTISCHYLKSFYSFCKYTNIFCDICLIDLERAHRPNQNKIVGFAVVLDLQR